MLIDRKHADHQTPDNWEYIECTRVVKAAYFVCEEPIQQQSK